MGSSLVAKSLKIYFLTDAGDDDETDFILFNNSSDAAFKDTSKEGAYIVNLERNDPEGIGNNQAAEKEDGNVQPLGIVEGTFVFSGFISNMRGDSDDGVNDFVTKLRTWKSAAQAIVNVWEAGRFGIIDASDGDNTLTPIGTGDTAIGLIFQDYKKINDYTRNRVNFTLTFRRSRGIDT